MTEVALALRVTVRCDCGETASGPGLPTAVTCACGRVHAVDPRPWLGPHDIAREGVALLRPGMEAEVPALGPATLTATRVASPAERGDPTAARALDPRVVAVSADGGTWLWCFDELARLEAVFWYIRREGANHDHPALTRHGTQARLGIAAEELLRAFGAAPPSPALLARAVQPGVDPRIPLLVAAHPDTPEAVLAQLPSDPEVDRALALRAGSPAALLPRLARATDPGVRRLVAERPDAPLAVLRALVADPDRWVRQALLPRADAEMLAALARDDRKAIRRLVAANPLTPVAALRRLARDPDPATAETARENPSFSPGFLERWFGVT